MNRTFRPIPFRFVLAFMAVAFVLAGCGHAPIPPVQEVLIPIAKPCEVEKVEPSKLATAQGVPNDIFEAVKRILADRQILLGDREELIAANTEPCGAIAP